MQSGWSEGVEINERMAQKKSREGKKKWSELRLPFHIG
jgi:hypothetical protein